MRLIGDLLGEVLANTAKLVAERKALIREGVGVPGEVRDQREDETVAIEGTRENTSAGTRPLPVVSQTGGGKSPRQAIDDLNCLHRPMKGGHDSTSVAIQTTTGVAITAYEIQK